MIRHQSPTDYVWEQRRVVARMKLEADRKLLLYNLHAPDYFAKWPEVAIRDYLLRHLDTPSRINLCKASRSVKKILGTKRDTWTLAEALISVPQLYKVLSNSHEDDVDPENKSTKGTSYSYLVNIRKIRSVCRDWRWAIDNFYKNFYSHLPSYSPSEWRRLLEFNPAWNGPMYSLSWTCWTNLSGHHPSPYTFDSESAMRFLNFFENGRFESSIITKRIDIFIERDNLTLLDNCGSQIRCAEINRMIEDDIVNEMMLIRDCLEKIPNLSALEIRAFDGDENTDEENNRASIDFPILPDLVSLTVSANDEGPLGLGAPLITSLSTYFPQLHTLVMADDNDVNLLEWYTPGMHSTFPNLQRLSLQVDSADGLLKLRHWKSPLKEVVFACSRVHIDIGVHIYALEKFWPTLVAIQFQQGSRCRKAITFEDLCIKEPTMLTMPNLEILGLALGCEACYDLDILLKLSRSPSFLELNHGECNHVHLPLSCNTRRLNLRRCHLDNVCDVNVWRLLPSLQILISGRTGIPSLFCCFNRNDDYR